MMMPDIETVLKGLECCMINDLAVCHICPYNIENSSICNRDLLLEDAFKLLKIQQKINHGQWIEKEWSTEDDWGCTNHRAITCSCCNQSIYKGEKTPYCPYCGAKMDL